MKSAEIRESFLSFFESKGAKRLPSSSLVPDDPSLLLTAAGMVQFKPIFLGAKNSPYSRATTCQKCVRTTDIDIIGTTGRHQSFFEMLGNFSFGDYFKEDACAWAWEYSTQVLKLDPDRIWISVFDDDDEAAGIWANIGVARDRIVRMGVEDNFWAAGPTGPCGPCSELYYDKGPEVGCGRADCAPGCDCDRFVEYWNLVFMQYDRAEDGSLSPLPKKNIDTGMGLERIAGILQGVETNYDTDILRGLIEVAEGLSGKTYGGNEKTDLSLRILADHSRAITFMIADGILPSNEGRGYVLRRLLRRAVRHGKLLDITGRFLGTLIRQVIEEMGSAYPEIVDNQDLIEGVVSSEEDRFGATLRQGLAFLEEEFDRLSPSQKLSGEKAFELHDTYGFPFELTVEIATERGIEVDEIGFDREMKAQRERARAQVKDESWSTFGGVYSDIAREVGETDFVGYSKEVQDATVVALVVDGHRVDSARVGDTVEVFLDATPFYGERGGQVGDTGMISKGTLAPGDLEHGITINVEDTQIKEGILVAHEGLVTGSPDESIQVGDSVNASIDHMRRERIRRNHTATHLLHWALHLIVGDHVKQAGSYVAPDRLRFDFTHFEALTDEQVSKVEKLVNAKVMENHDVRAYETSLTVARESGVTALFGEKYGEFVRVLEIGNFSKELCGGTHIGRTSEIGFVKIVSEGSVGANLRRIEAVTSFDALAHMDVIEAELKETAASLKVPMRDVSERVAAMITELKENKTKRKRAKETLLDDDIVKLIDQADIVGHEGSSYPLIIAKLEGFDGAALRDMWDVIKQRLQKPGAAVLASVDSVSGAPFLLAAASDAAVEAGFDAGRIIHEVSGLIKGGGGGKPTMAQAGGKDSSGIDAVIETVRAMFGLS